LAGRVPEALSRFEDSAALTLGPIADLGGVFNAIALVLAGRGDEALPWIDRTERAAIALDAEAARIAAIALRAEITHDEADVALLPAVSSVVGPGGANSLSDLLVLRAHVANGDSTVVTELQRSVERLAMPGLAVSGSDVGDLVSPGLAVPESGVGDA